MKHLLLAIAFIHFLLSVSGQTFNEVQAKEADIRFGRTLSVKTMYFRFESSTLPDSEKLLHKDLYFQGSDEYTFNDHAKEIIKYMNSSADSPRLERHYDESGNLVLELDIKRSDTFSRHRHVIRYSNNKLPVQNSFYTKSFKGQEWLFQLTKNEFDAHGNLVETVSVDSSHRLKEKSTYTYDKSGLKTEETLFRGKISFVSIAPCGSNERNPAPANTSYHQKWIYKYDANRREIEKIELNPSNCIVKRNTFVYDSSGNIIEKYVYNENSTLIWNWKAQYSGDKLISLESFDEVDKTGVKTTYAYDKTANAVIETAFLGNIPRIINRTEYDKKGNWVKRTVYANGKLISIDERTITYQDK